MRLILGEREQGMKDQKEYSCGKKETVKRRNIFEKELTGFYENKTESERRI